jgi:multidrug efflux pump subunit AcrB
MFGLGGVAGFLFRPLAEAVIFALVSSYILSRTLVPTLANYLLRPHAASDMQHGADGDPIHAAAKPTRNPLVKFQRGFERAFEAVRASYLGLLQLGLHHRGRLILGFLTFSILSMGLEPYLGQDFFPNVDGGQIKLHFRAQTGTRIEQTTKLADEIGTAIQKIVPPKDLGDVVDNIGMSASPINTGYNNSGTIGMEDADILISLKPGHGPTDDYVRRMRELLPREFPGTSFAFLPADIVSQVLNFGVPAPIDLQLVGDNVQANRAYADELLQKIRHIPGIADARIQQDYQQPTLNVNVDRSLAGLVGLSEKDAATGILTTLGGSTQTSPTYWLNPATGVSYPVSVQAPQPSIDTLGLLRNLPLTGGAAGASGPASQLLGGLATISRVPSDAVVSHYNVRRIVDIYATTQGQDLGAVAAGIRQVMQQTAHDLPRGSSLALRGQVATMTSAYQQLYVGLAFAIVLIYLLIVVNFQSWLDPFVIVMALPTALAGIVWMLFTTGTTLSVPALTGAIMCMGVATANSILVISFARERMAAGATALEAAMEAGSTRFRPVLMTALAMVIGMIPMAIEPGQNAPLGRAVIGGLIFATCATLFLVPSLFSLVHARDHKKAETAPTVDALPTHA